MDATSGSAADAAAATTTRRGRLLLLESLPSISGGQAELLSLASALQADRDVWALLPGPGPLSTQLAERGVRCHLVPMGSYTLRAKTWRDVWRYALEQPRLLLAARRLILGAQINLVYANSSRTFAWGTLAASLARRPILWHQHVVLADAKTLWLLRLLGRLPTVRNILCASGEVAGQFASLQSKLAVIPHGVNTERFRPDPELGRAARGALGLPVDAFVVGMAGDLIPLKGHTTLLSAVQHLGPLGRLHVCVVGAPRPDAESQRYFAALRAEATTAGLSERVHLVGRQSDMAAALNAFDLLVIASSTETVPLVLLEALACGVPVVSTPVGWAPRLLSDGRCGALFPIGDAGQLAGTLRRLQAEPAVLAEMSREARRLAEERLQAGPALQHIVGLVEASLAVRSS